MLDPQLYSDIYLKEMKTGFEYLMPMFIDILFTAAKIRKQPKCQAMDEYKKKT